MTHTQTKKENHRFHRTGLKNKAKEKQTMHQINEINLVPERKQKQ